MVGISNSSVFASSNTVNETSRNTAASAARLASGRRLTAASDDIAALATGTALNSQVTGLRGSLNNVTQTNSLLQVAGGALTQQLNILDRQKALSVQASSGQLSDSARSALNQEFQSLSAELDRIAASTNFNGVALLDGSTPTLSSDPIDLELSSTTTTTLFAGQSLSIGSQVGAQNAATALDTAIQTLSAAQANIGSQQSRLDVASDALRSAISNQQSAASALLNTDIAAESTRFAASRVQEQASISVQAQTNKLSQGLLRLVQ